MSYDLLIKNGTVVDGTGAKPRRADVAIAAGKVAEIGKVVEGTSSTAQTFTIPLHDDSPMGWVPQTYLPEGRRYYEPVDRGHEALIRQRLEALRRLLAEQGS